MTDVRATLVDAAENATRALQKLRDEEKAAAKAGKTRTYARLATTYDAAKETADAATAKLINDLVQLPGGKADELATATEEMKKQIEEMDKERQTLADLTAAFEAVTAIIMLIGMI